MRPCIPTFTRLVLRHRSSRSFQSARVWPVAHARAFQSYRATARYVHTSSTWFNAEQCGNVNTKPRNTSSGGTPVGKVEQPKLMIAFTCKKCDKRSSHTMSRQAYTGGTVLITCPHCKNRHLIADHLKIFSDSKITIQDILKSKGESVSQNLDDLVFEDIPEELKKTMGAYAKDAPKDLKDGLKQDTVHSLPEEEKIN